MVYYLNSAISPIYTWIPIKEALERAWEPYVTKGGKHDAKRSGLTHKFDFPIAQQTGLMCGFHVCHHMSNLSQQVNTFDPECRLLRDRYPKPLIFHDGHLAFLPTPSAVLAFFLFPPLGVTLSVIRISIGIVVSYKISFSAGAVFGVRFRTSGLRALEPGVKRRGILYVCTHRTLVDPIMLTAALQKPVPTMTYSLSQLSEIIAPISTVRLTRDRVRDAETMSCLLEHGDLTVCPEGTTCREPYLLWFSPLFAELADDMEPVVLDVQVTTLYGTTVSGHKWLDPVVFFANPQPAYRLEFLGAVPREWPRTGGRPGTEVANWVQRRLGEALRYECTGLTRRDKYMMFAGNDGVVAK
ncbi:glycerol-3-phosphate acyltransferase 1-like [Oryza brachyantha]|uniref:glycerol-3-phosphate acyltransferase 1-like n=1 Tax=Oryza brachyantha TaxID=4533 RepID=UPI001ADAF101|nr:glycerol-3-phosphate acyltransferase 1-like [Oryza brachyantha]